MHLSILIKLIALCFVAYLVMVSASGHAGMAAVFLILLAALDAGSHERVQAASNSTDQAIELLSRLSALSVWPFYLILGGLIGWGALQAPKPMQPVFSRANITKGLAPSAPLKVQSPGAKPGSAQTTPVPTRPYSVPPPANRPAFQRLPKPGADNPTPNGAGAVTQPPQASQPKASGTAPINPPQAPAPKASEPSSVRAK